MTTKKGDRLLGSSDLLGSNEQSKVSLYRGPRPGLLIETYSLRASKSVHSLLNSGVHGPMV